MVKTDALLAEIEEINRVLGRLIDILTLIADTFKGKPEGGVMMHGWADLPALAKRYRALVEASRREHYHCDDSYYCCPLCASEDHGWPIHIDSNNCTCGADAWNARIDALLNWKEPTH